MKTGRRELLPAADLPEPLENGLVCLRGPLGNHVFGEDLAGERRRFQRQRLRGRKLLAIDIGSGDLAVFNREQRLAGFALEDEYVTRLGELYRGIDQIPVALHGDETGRDRQVAIPDVMLDNLKMPDTLARLRLQRNQRIREQIVSKAVGAVEIESRRPGRNEQQPALFIQTHAAPIVRGSTIFPGVLRPGLVPELARMGNRVEAPAKLSGTDVVGPDVTGRRGESFADDTAKDE